MLLNTNRHLKSFFVLLFFSFLVLLLDRFQILNPVKVYSEKLFLPSKKAIFQNWQSIGEKLRAPGRDRDSDRNRELNKRVEELEKEIATLTTHNSQLTTKNKAAQRLLGTPLPPEWQFMPANTAGLINGILTLDKGQIDGVEIGQPVLVEDIFVGKVEKVGKYQSWVELPVAKGAKLLAKVIPDKAPGNAKAQNEEKSAKEPEAKAKGLLVGYRDKMKLEKVLQKEMLTEGDLVITGEFPPNLVIGEIKNVVKKDVEIYQSAEVEPMVDYQKLEIVFLLK